MIGVETNSSVRGMTRNVIRGVFAVVLSCVLSLTPSLAFSQDKEDDAESLVPRAPSPPIVTVDGLPLNANYWPSKLKAQGSVVVLLHGLNGNQLDWGQDLPKQLQDRGHAVIAVDLRGHGQSTGKPMGLGNDAVETKAKAKSKPAKSKPAKAAVEATSLKARDFALMVGSDMKAVKYFILQEHQKEHLNMNKMAIVGAGLGATVALKFAEMDWEEPPHEDGPEGNKTPRGQDVRALVLLTPDADVSGLPLPDTIKYLRQPALQVAMFFAVGNKDKQDKGQTKKLYDQANSPPEINKNRMYFKEYNSAAHGCGLLAGKNLPIEQNIINFLDQHLSKVNSVWRDRESRVGRKSTK
jgi:pimeloyl-ACP methyl ester carboxylesterase